MDPGGPRSWPHGNGDAAGQGQPPPPPPPRPSYGPGTPQHQPQQSPPNGPSGLPPPGTTFTPYHQAHSLHNLAGISQASPRAPLAQSHRPEDRPHERPPPGFGLPSLSQATGQPPHAVERERERERELERVHIKDEEDRRHRDHERQRLEQAPPHQAQHGPPPHLHQPVAVGPRTVHGPNGLLGNPAIAGPQGPPPQHMPLGAPSGPANIFAGGPVQPSQAHPQGQPMQPGLLAPYSQGPPPPPAQQQQQQQQQQQMAPQQGQGQGQGQQPILNDALSYLDQVKVQFADQPDVYNRFLDIMKDFKSGAIDTPGVIGRVSTLFAGNPELIQGFNTFLPPGYRIECGTGDDPNAIRVTTPMGTTVSSMPQPRPLSRQGDRDHPRPANGTFTPQPGAQSAQMMYSPSGRPVGPAAPTQQHVSPQEALRQQQDHTALHQQEQRGVSSLQNAVSAATAGAGLRAGVSPRSTPMPAQATDLVAADGTGEKRGPVEFNHAISYVNKIKNRFASQPDIYKQFLEILQTYQRESKPIQDVYSQVTKLFNAAPDLLDDFKQFLPESAAQAKQAAERARQEAENSIMPSNVRNEERGMYGSPVVSREHMGTPAGRPGAMPPIGNFAPTPASKDNKRKRDQRGGTADRAVDGLPGPSGAKAQYPAQQNKRIKTQAVAKGHVEQPPTSPSLVPALPAPIPPTTTSAATGDELSFFDRAKKAIGNKNVYNEFLKLCNLFSQDLIDRSTLAFRARSFIGGNPDLVTWFEKWLGYDERDIVIENKPRVPSGRVMLANCRGLGPSYRLLPKRERQKPCSGRDELCNAVLNDEWASHPTWASEDSGFIAHRKNVHEEGLHRIEEERHDYDYNIEACSRTIQLLEPIAQQLRRMDDHAQRSYQLPPGLGGQSETIYKRVIMKLYGREKGADVIRSLEERPYQVIPVLLNRLKERLETWKMAQREWEKVWREQTQKMFWKSLDHQAADQKKNDRRQFQMKNLQSEMQVKYEEMKRAANMNPAIMRQPQMEFHVSDAGVLVDTTHLLLAHVEQAYDTEHPVLFPFIRDFVPLFFGINSIWFREQIEEKIQQRTPNNELADDLASGEEDSASVKARKAAAGKIGSNLYRQTLDRGRKLTRKDREESNASGSRASTPDVTSRQDEEMAVDSVEDVEGKQDVSTGRWLDHPISGNASGSRNIDPHEPQPRDVYRFWANSSSYGFIRLFMMLYERLCTLKDSEDAVRRTVRNGGRVKPAIELGIIDKTPADFFDDTSAQANYYTQMLQKFEDVLKGKIEIVDVEDTLRRFYLQSGYPLYPFEKIIMQLAKNALTMMASDSKDKSADVVNLFKRDRAKETSTAQQQTDYRKAVEKLVKDSEVYRIDYARGGTEWWPEHAISKEAPNSVKIYLSRKDDPIADDGLTEMDRENRWRYYVASYTSIDHTDGVNIADVSYPFLLGNVRAYGADPSDESFPPTTDSPHAQTIKERSRFLDVKNEEKLELRIAVNNFHALFQPGTYESWHTNLQDRTGGPQGIEGAEELRTHREEAILENLLMNHGGMKDLSKEDVEGKNTGFADLLEKNANGLVSGKEGSPAGEEERMDVDA